MVSPTGCSVCDYEGRAQLDLRRDKKCRCAPLVPVLQFRLNRPETEHPNERVRS